MWLKNWQQCLLTVLWHICANAVAVPIDRCYSTAGGYSSARNARRRAKRVSS